MISHTSACCCKFILYNWGRGMRYIIQKESNKRKLGVSCCEIFNEISWILIIKNNLLYSNRGDCILLLESLKLRRVYNCILQHLMDLVDFILVESSGNVLGPVMFSSGTGDSCNFTRSYPTSFNNIVLLWNYDFSFEGIPVRMDAIVASISIHLEC